MAKSYLLTFDDNFTELIEEFARDDRMHSGRQWIQQLVFAKIKVRQEAKKVFDLVEYVFQMKDGTMKRSSGANPGAAWQSMGYKTEQAQDLMITYRTLEVAQAEGWLKKESAAVEQIKTGEDLPFGH